MVGKIKNKQIKKIEKNQTEEVGEGYGIAGFVLGIIGFLTAGGFFIIPLLGLIFSIIQMRKKSTGLSIAGLVLNIIGITMALAFIIAILYVVGFISILLQIISR
jgi:hypothetical protein